MIEKFVQKALTELKDIPKEFTPYKSIKKAGKEPVFASKSDFEVIQLPKIKFFIDHQNRKMDKNGKIIGDDEFGGKIKIDN